ncbi:hypothetical protein GF362_05995 [Candidatus Dojkabacteria bacterium]|nr:hypothetical protein [Candidatus Dojkabacteria bacterium]
MLTKKRQQILKGIFNNFVSKSTGYPTALIYSKLDKEIKYELSILEQTIEPEIELDQKTKKIFNNLYNWLRKEMETRKVDKNNIKNCLIKVNINKERFFFIPYYIYKFEFILETKEKIFQESSTIKGWL